MSQVEGFRTSFGISIGRLENKSMKRCRWKSFFENPKPVVSHVEPSAIQKQPHRPKWLGLSIIAVVLVVGGAEAWAQQPTKILRIGYLSNTDPANESARSEGIRLALRERGYIEGQNIATEYRYAEGKLDRLPELAAELVRLKVDVIVAAGGTPAILAAKNATGAIPIVFPTVSDPVALGIVASLKHSSPSGTLLPRFTTHASQSLRQKTAFQPCTQTGNSLKPVDSCPTEQTTILCIDASLLT